MRSKAYYKLEEMFNQRQMEGRDAEIVVRFMLSELRRSANAPREMGNDEQIRRIRAIEGNR